MKRTDKSQREKVVTFVGDGVLHLWAFVIFVGVVTVVGATWVLIVEVFVSFSFLFHTILIQNGKYILFLAEV